MFGHGADDAGPDIRDRAELDGYLLVCKVIDELGVFPGARAMPDPIDIERSHGTPDAGGPGGLAGVRGRAEPRPRAVS